MTSSWYKDFQNRLGTVTARKDSSRFGVLNNIALTGLGDKDPSFSGNRSPNGVGEHLMDWGGRALDIISRPGYAAGGLLNTILEESINPEQEKNPLEEMMQGLMGKKKEFFHPYQTIDPAQESDSTLEKGGRFLTDFIASLAGDPTTYIPGAAIAKGFKAGADVTGISKGIDAIKKSSAPQNDLINLSKSDLDAQDMLTDTVRLKDDLDKFKVSPELIQPPLSDVKANTYSPGVNDPFPDNESFIRSLINDPKIKYSITGDLNHPAAIKGAEAGAHDLRYRSGNPSVDLGAWNILRSDIADKMSKMRGKLYENGQFDNPWRDDFITRAIERPEVKEFPEIPAPVGKTIDTPAIAGTPGFPVETSARRNAAIRGLINSSEDAPKSIKAAEKLSAKNPQATYYHADSDSILINGKAHDVTKWVDEQGIANDPKKWEQFKAAFPDLRISATDMEKGPLQLTPESYIKALTGDSSRFENTVITHGVDDVPFRDYAASRNKKWAEKAKGTPGTPASSVPLPPLKKDVAAYEKAVAAQAKEREAYEAAVKAADAGKTDLVRAKPDSESRKAWLAKHYNNLANSDLKKLDNLMRLGNEKGFNNFLDQIMTREGNLDLDTFDALEAAVKSGRIPKEEAKAFYASFGAKNATDAKHRVESIESKIQKLREKIPTEKLGPANRLNNIEVANRRFRNYVPENLGEEAKPLPIPKISPREVRDLKRVGYAYSSRVADDILGATTSPVIANVLDKVDKDLLMQSLKTTLDKEYLVPKGYKFKTLRQGTLRNSPTPGEGLGRNYAEFNRRSQFTLWKNALGNAVKKLPEGLVGTERAGFLYDKIMPVLKAHDDMLRAYGIHPSLVESGKGLPLSHYDILSSLDKETAMRYVFNRSKEITPAQFMTIAEEAYRVDNLDDLKDIVKLHLQGGKGYEGADKFSAAGNAQRMGASARKNTEKRQAKQGKSGDNYTKEAVYRGMGVEKNAWERTVNDIASEAFVSKIRTKVNYNSDRAGIQRGTFVQKATDENLAKFVEDMKAITTQDEILSLLENTRKGVAKFSRDTSDIVVPPGAIDEIKDGVDAAITNPSSEVAAKQLAENSAATSKNGRVAVDTKVKQSIDDKIDEIMSDVPGYDFSARLELKSMGRFMHAVNPHLSEGPLRHLLLSGENVAKAEAAHFTQRLNTFERTVGKEQATQMWRDIAAGAPPKPEFAAQYNELHKLISSVFDSKSTGGGLLKREGIDPGHLNSNLRHFKIDSRKYGLSGKDFDEAYGSWRDWAPFTEDPLHLLSRYHAAVRKTISEKHFGTAISDDFGSKVMKPGYGRIVASSGRSRIAHLVDTRMYYPTEVLDNLRMLDRTLIELAKPGTDNKLLQIFDNMTHKYKAGLTIYRPGHHVRNEMGDVWLNAMDGVIAPKYYDKAWRALATRKHHYSDELMQTKTDIDMLGAKAADTAVTVRVGGRDVHLSYDTIYRMVYKEGGLPTYQSLEDLGVGSTVNAAEKVEGKRSLTSPFGGRAHKLAADTSEIRDHHIRLTHFIGLMDKNTGIKLARREGESIEAATERALTAQTREYIARVRKFHPDGSDLSQFERNVAKRGILFYAWIRKMIPLVIESYFLRPGRFLAFPKAMYTLAESNGIDLNGFTDPFPTDQLFPEWMGGNQGPAFGDSSHGYLGVRPGIPMMDILDQYFANPGQTWQTLMSATHPLVKIPFELSTGTTTQGVPIKDVAKYAVGQVPFGGLVNTTLDKPIGGVSPSDEGYNPEGIRDPKTLAWLNMLTGLGVMDMSKPSSIKSAQFDAKYGKAGG